MTMEDKKMSESKKSSIHGASQHRANKSRDIKANAVMTNVMASGNQIVGGNLKKQPLTTRAGNAKQITLGEGDKQPMLNGIDNSFIDPMFS